MNHRYVQIIATCLIAGTITLAMKHNKTNYPVVAEKNTLTINTTQKEPKTQDLTITLEPDISSKDLSYKYGLLSYSPTSVSLTVNDEEIEINNDEPIVVKIDGSNTVTTRCKYKFIAGHEGEKVSTQTVTPGETYAVTFDWKSPEKIQLEGAKVISANEAPKEEEDDDDDEKKESQAPKSEKKSDNADEQDEECDEDDEKDEVVENNTKTVQPVAKTAKPVPTAKSMPSFTTKKDMPSFFNNKNTVPSDVKE